MNKAPFLYRLIALGFLIFGLPGCVFDRANGDAGDIDEFVPPVTFAQANTVIRFQPVTQQLGIGSTAIVEIWIDNVTGLFGTEIQIQFEPNLLQVQDTDPNEEGIQIQPGNFLAPDFVAANEADNVTGDIFYTVTQRAPTPPANGSGVLAIISFIARAEGSSQLTFNVVKLSNPNGEQIPAIAQAGQIIIGQPPGEATPTLFPTPIQPTATSTFTPVPIGVTSAPTLVPPTATSITTPSPTLPPPLPPPSATPTPPLLLLYTPVPPMTHVPPGATIGFCYRVQLGETIYDVAKKFMVNPDAINLVNDLYPPHQILAYQALFIPQEKGRGPNVYIVQPGDTLDSIGDRCKLPASMIAKINKLGPNATVEVGQVLVIPIPPYPPPSRFNYPTGPLPIVKFPPPPCCKPAPVPYGGK